MTEYSLLHIFKEIYKWRRHIALATGLVGLITLGICLMLPNYYKATTTFYASNQSLANPSALGYEESNRFVFGNSEDMDRLFSILVSSEVSSYLIRKFDLYSVYGIDSTTAKGKNAMAFAFSENYKVIATKYEAIELSVEDTDPKRAADIANGARDFANDIFQRLIKSSQRNTLESMRKNLEIQEKIVTQLADSITAVKQKTSLIDPYFQSETYSEEAIKAEAQYADAKAKAAYYSKYESKKDSTIKYNAIAAGLQSRLSKIRSDLKVFYQYGPWLKKKEQEYSRAGDQLSIEKEKEKLLMATYNSSFPGLHVIDKAYPPMIKSRPKRTMIIIGAMFLAFTCAILGVLTIQSLKVQQS